MEKWIDALENQYSITPKFQKFHSISPPPSGYGRQAPSFLAHDTKPACPFWDTGRATNISVHEFAAAPDLPLLLRNPAQTTSLASSSGIALSTLIFLSRIDSLSGQVFDDEGYRMRVP
ncbi:MAG TPA: hypothetical protein VLA17_11520 [Candidatus Limnocylindria bacterium]|nr:hypothetical protein [Candidatus Limnocylindria bacterium]